MLLTCRDNDLPRERRLMQRGFGWCGDTPTTGGRKAVAMPFALGRLNRPVNQSSTGAHCTQIDAPDNENESRTFMSGKNIPYETWSPPPELPPLRKRMTPMMREKAKWARTMHDKGYLWADIARTIDADPGRVAEAHPGTLVIREKGGRLRPAAAATRCALGIVNRSLRHGALARRTRPRLFARQRPITTASPSLQTRRAGRRGF